MTRTELTNILSNRIMIIDGAMGTMIQRHKLEENDYRGERFKATDDVIPFSKNIREAFLEAIK